MTVRRMNWGCGCDRHEGWLNTDRRMLRGVDVCADIRWGLPFPDASFEYIASNHALQMLAYGELIPALGELRRVLRPGGVLRMGLPDMDRAIDAYRAGDPGYFYVPDDDAATLGGKLSVQLTWYGSSQALFNFDYARELLEKAGFNDITRSSFRHSESGYAEVASIDNRERESFFVEATK